ncbi:MAG: peptidylprolyl isomerase [Novosphingobium sp.]
MPMRQALMDGLISEKLLAEEAVKAGLDKQAATAQAIAAAERSVLAQAYVHKLSAGGFRPGDRDVQKYYAAHQEQFGQRRRFVLNEYVVRSDLPEVRRYVEVLDKQGVSELGNILRSVMPAIAQITLVRFSDEIPDAKDTLRNMKAGDAIVYQTPGQLHLGQVQSVEADPVAIEAVRPRIEASIAAQRRAELVRTTVERLRKTRKIEVLHTSFAGGANRKYDGEAQP